MLEETVAIHRVLVRRGLRVCNSKALHRRQPLVLRHYATQTSLGTTSPIPRRKKVTVLNDTGQVRWGDLTVGEKIARSTQQSVNFSVILVGLLMTGGVAVLLWTDVFSSQSKTNHFNRAVDRIRNDSRCTELLGPSSKITAYGEPSWNKWRRNRPIASAIETDKYGIATMRMHFNVSGPLNDGIVYLEMTKHPAESKYKYRFLALDVPGQPRIYLENAELDKSNTSASSGFKLFGKKWG